MRRGADHKLLRSHRESDAGHTVQVGGSVLVFAVGHGLCRGDGLAIEVSCTRTVLNVVGSLTLVGPELALRLVYNLLHADGIARDAERIADGLCREGPSVPSTPRCILPAWGDKV